MASKSTSLNARNRSGAELAYQQHETDSPILPVAQLERLAKLKPDAVQWCIEQTQLEAEHRRAEQSQINRYIFIKHVLGQTFGFLIGLSGYWWFYRGNIWPTNSWRNYCHYSNWHSCCCICYW